MNWAGNNYGTPCRCQALNNLFVLTNWHAQVKGNAYLGGLELELKCGNKTAGWFMHFLRGKLAFVLGFFFFSFFFNQTLNLWNYLLSIKNRNGNKQNCKSSSLLSANCLNISMTYWECNFPITPFVGRSVGPSVGLSLFPKKDGKVYNPLLLSEHFVLLRGNSFAGPVYSTTRKALLTRVYRKHWTLNVFLHLTSLHTSIFCPSWGTYL